MLLRWPALLYIMWSAALVPDEITFVAVSDCHCICKGLWFNGVLTDIPNRYIL